MIDIGVSQGEFLVCDKPRWRRGPKSVAPARISDIECDATRQVNCQTLPSLGIPLLYAFSEDLKTALMTFHRDSRRLLDSPFLYQAQAQDADTCCFADSEALEACWSATKANPVFVISPGRVGSTLFSNIIKYGGATCLSEPDVLSSFKMSNYRAGTPEFQARFEKLLLLSVNSLQDVTGDAQLVIKLRSYSAPLISVLAKLYENGKFIFIFREVEAWATSMVRAFKYNDRDLRWVMEQNINTLRSLRSAGRETLALNYDLLMEQPAEVIESIRCFIGPEIEIDVEKAAGALLIDSQKGSGLDRALLAKKSIDRTSIDLFLAYWCAQKKNDFHELGIAFLNKP